MELNLQPSLEILFFAKGRAVKVFGVRCPATDTDEGLQAKRIANAYLSGSRVKCAVKRSKSGQLGCHCSQSYG